MNYSKSFSSASSLAIAGTEHNFGTANLLVNCYSAVSPYSQIQPSSVTVNPSTFAIAITFASAQSGRCVVNGSGGSGLTPSAGGDLSGLLSSASVTGLQSRPVSAVMPTDRQVLTWNQSSGQWQPQTMSGSSATGSSQLNVLSATYTSPTVLTLGAGCSNDNPCNIRFGNTAYSIVNSATATLQSGNGTAFIYVTNAGVLTVGSNLGIVCSSSCVAAAELMPSQ